MSARRAWVGSWLLLVATACTHHPDGGAAPVTTAPIDASVISANETSASASSAVPSASSSASSSASAAPVASFDLQHGTYFGRTPSGPMGYQGASWLDRKDRDATEQPEHVLDVIGVSSGQTVADIGCGSGYFTLRIAKRVAPQGRVLASDVQPEMLALLAKKVTAAHADDVVPILATSSDAKLPANAIDIALMVDVYHELARPDLELAQLRTALKPSGKLVLVEYRAEDPKVAISPAHKMTLPQIKRELEGARYTFVSSDESLPEQRIVTFMPTR